MEGVKNKQTILVTGGLGFIGSHFIEMSLAKGLNVVNVDKITYASNTEMNDVFLKNYPEQYRFIKKDINDLEEIPHCDYIVHFAAESHVDNSIRDTDIFTKSNILGTQNILNLLVKIKRDNLFHAWNVALPTMVYISTDEVFGDIENGFFKEYDRYNPSNPYAASKAAAEMLVKSYGRTYGIPYQITRTTNNYGPRQHFEKLIPHCITQALSNRKIKIQGSGQQVRTWIHVEDNCRAIFEVMTRGEINNVYHIASDEELSVKDVAKIILEKFGKFFNSDSVEHVQDRSGQDIRYALNCSKIKMLGWKPEHTFSKAVENVIEYHRKKIQTASLNLENPQIF